MKAISINAYEIENDDGETMVFMTPKEFDFIKKQNELKDKEIERLNNIINKAIEYTKIQIEDEYEYHGLIYHNDEKDKLLDILKGVNKE